MSDLWTELKPFGHADITFSYLPMIGRSYVPLQMDARVNLTVEKYADDNAETRRALLAKFEACWAHLLSLGFVFHEHPSFETTGSINMYGEPTILWARAVFRADCPHGYTA